MLSITRNSRIAKAKQAVNAAEAAAGRAAFAAGAVPTRSASREFVSGWLAAAAPVDSFPAELNLASAIRWGLVLEEIE